jgi:hypothetical protein
VLYFYSQRPATLSVRVDFPRGLITEWYPRESKALPENTFYQMENGRLEWNGLEVRPGDAAAFPAGAGKSRYYAARDTEASPLAIAGEREKLIFYRGVGNMTIPLLVTSPDENTIELRNSGGLPIAAAVLFENRGGQIGYRVLRDVNGSRKVDLPSPGASEIELRKDLEAILVEQGLYAKEAHAMVETWRDSWFEEGARVFYILPRAAVDAAVPLTVSPTPKETVRVFVGRIELLTPRTEWAIDAALATGDVATLEKYGRFLSILLDQMKARGKAQVQSRDAKLLLDGMLAKMAREYSSPSCVK